MNLTLLSTLRLGKSPRLLFGILALAGLGCDTHPLLSGVTPTGTYVGTETKLVTTPSGQTYTTTHTIPMITIPTPTFTETHSWNPPPTTSLTNSNSATFPTTATNTSTPTWSTTDTGTATVPATYTTGTSTWTATAPATATTGTNTWTITVTSANQTNTFTAIVAIPPTATYVTNSRTNSLTATATRTLPTSTATTTRTAPTFTPTSTVTSTTTRTSIAANVTFGNGQAQGLMTGWGWVAGGPLDPISSPGCSSTPINPSSPCTTAYLWNSPNALCLTADIPALPAIPVQSDYDQNWGVMIGVNAKEPNGPIGFSFAAINVSLSGQIAGVSARLLLHVAGDPDSFFYCAYFGGTAVPLSSFNTACWDLSGKTFDPALSGKVDKIMVQVPSESNAIAIRNLCLNSILFY